MNQYILLVEDDRLLLDSIAQMLTNEDYQVDKAETVMEARQKYHNKYDMVILDISLPDGDGFEICQMIRSISTVPIIFLTAYDDEESIVKGLDLGADDYIVKPFRKYELLSRMRAHLRRQVINVKTNLYRSGDLVVHVQKHIVVKGDKEIMLRPVEYALLLSFLENPQIIRKREQILEKIWDENENFVDGTTLTVQISRLRARLGKYRGEDYISTIRGFGYRWNYEVHYGTE